MCPQLSDIFAPLYRHYTWIPPKTSLQSSIVYTLFVTLSPISNNIYSLPDNGRGKCIAMQLCPSYLFISLNIFQLQNWQRKAKVETSIVSVAEHSCSAWSALNWVLPVIRMSHVPIHINLWTGVSHSQASLSAKGNTKSRYPTRILVFLTKLNHWF